LLRPATRIERGAIANGDTTDSLFVALIPSAPLTLHCNPRLKKSSLNSLWIDKFHTQYFRNAIHDFL